MLFNKKFDLIISLGEDCACSSYLRRFNLQFSSYPFDWLTFAPFVNRINLLYNNFERFLNIEDMKFLPKENIESSDKNCDYYENTFNKFYFYHDFPINVPLEDSFKSVKEKYDRRIKRMYEKINNANNILFVWWSRDKHLSNQEVIKAYQKIQNKYSSKDIYFLIIEYKNIKDFEYEQINNNILKVSYDNISYKFNKKYNETMGHEKNNHKVFSQIKLKTDFSQKIKICTYRIKLFFINNFIPIKKVRIGLRDKVKKDFSHAAL